MKHILRPKFLPILVLLFSVLGFLLRLQTFGTGPDGDGLYAPQPVAWWLLVAVTVAALTLIAITVARLRANGSFSDNFPPSVSAAAGCVFALVGLISSALPLLSAGDGLSTATGLIGLAASAAMVAVAIARYKGAPPFFLCHPAISIYLGLRIFLLGKQWGNESQLGLFLLPLFSLIFVMMASYHLATFDVELGVRKTCLFWSLGGAYFCIVTLADRSEPLLYGGLAVWLLTNLCSLRPIKKRCAEEPQEQPPQEEAAPEVLRPMTMDEIDQHMDLK